MNWIKRMLCAASAAVMLLTAQFTAFAAAPTYTKEEAWEAIQNTDLKVATRKYDIDCVDINDLTTQDKQLFFDIYWDQFTAENSFPPSIDYFKEHYFGGINSTFYGKAPTKEKLQELYSEADKRGYNTVEARASHPDLPAQTTTAFKDSLKPNNQEDEQPANTTADTAVDQETEATETSVTQNDTADQETEGIPNWIIIVAGVVILGGAVFVVYKKQKS